MSSLVLYKIFETVAKSKNYQAAANLLNYTPSAISHAITRLENSIGIPLVKRGKNEIYLTSQGQELLIYIEELLACEQRIEAYSEKLKRLEAGYIRLGLPVSLCNSWLPSITNTFHERFPSVKLHITEYRCNLSPESKLPYELDIAVIVHSQYDCKRYPRETELYNDNLICIMAENQQPETGQYMTLKELKNYSLIAPKSLYDQSLHPFFLANNIEMNYAWELNNENVIASMVSSEAGISIMPVSFLKNHFNNISYYPIEGNPYRVISMITPASYFNSPALEWLSEIIFNYAKSESFRQQYYMNGSKQSLF